MIVVVDDIRERIALCGMTAAQFMQLIAIIRLAMGNRNEYIQAVATRLYRNSHWIHDTTPGRAMQVTLADLNWGEAFILMAVITELAAKAISGRQRTLADEILEGLNAAVESSLRTDKHQHLSDSRF